MLIVLGFLAGILSSMGVGGGTLLVPCLVHFYDAPQVIAQGVIMTIFLPTAAVALFSHYKNGYLRLNIALYLALGGLGGAVIGAWLATHLTNDYLSWIFGAFLIITGLQQIFSKKKNAKKS